MPRSTYLLAAVLVTAACSETVRLDKDGGPVFDADPTPAPTCTPGATECANCIDDDGDDLTDGDDPHCAGPLDDDETTFATAIPGDNKDRFKQDCFFDGNSGGSCQIDTCCLLSQEVCEGGDYGGWPPADCDFDQTCVDECSPLTPPGCDCFGCCTVCNPATDLCADVLTNPAVSPGCSFDQLDQPDVCVPCQKSALCHGGECGGDGCVLCPGQTEEDLPPRCDEMNECPNDGTPCDVTDDCSEADNEYCSNSCCVSVE